MRPSRWAAPAVAAAVAPLAHFAIDAFGDAVLRHDTYDDVGHASRPLLAGAALLVAGLLALFVVRLAVQQSRAHGAPLRAFLRALAPRNAARFAAAVAALATCGVLAMGAFDALAAGSTIDDPADLLAGAPLFALAVALVIGAACGCAAAYALRLLARADAAIVRAVAAVLRIARDAAGPSIARVPAVRPALARRTPPLARRRALRAPPPPTR